jgi:hypothetical protein
MVNGHLSFVNGHLSFVNMRMGAVRLVAGRGAGSHIARVRTILLDPVVSGKNRHVWREKPVNSVARATQLIARHRPWPMVPGAPAGAMYGSPRACPWVPGHRFGSAPEGRRNVRRYDVARLGNTPYSHGRPWDSIHRSSAALLLLDTHARKWMAPFDLPRTAVSLIVDP